MHTKFVLSVLGQDRPGIVALVTRILADYKCNIEDLTQTILQCEFAAIIIFSAPVDFDLAELEKDLQGKLAAWDLSAGIKKKLSRESDPAPAQPFVVTTIGGDQIGQIGRLTSVLKNFACNITKINAINRSELYPEKVVMIFEIDVPLDADIHALKKAMGRVTDEMHIEFSVQHRDIFENIHRI